MADQNFRVKRGLEVGIGGTVITTTSGGSVGIGTTNPTNKLEVYGDIGVGTSYNHRIAGQNSNAYNIGFNSTSTLIWGLQTSGGITTTLTITGWGDGNAYIDNRNNGDIYFRSGSNTLPNSTSLVFKNGGTLLIGTATSTGTASQTLQVHSGGAYFSGSVGVGITNPQQKLDVRNGTILVVNPDASGLRVLSGAATSYTSMTIGRTAGDASISVAGGAGQWATDSSSGDLVIRTETTSTKLLFTNGANNATLAVANNNVGIGTTNPTGRLHVGAASTQSVVITSTGSMVIGGTSAAAKLYVNGGANNYTPSASGTGLFEVNAGATSLYSMYIGIDDQGGYFGHNGSSRKLFFDTNETTRMTIDGSGNVGIGTTNPASKLDVRGSISIGRTDVIGINSIRSVTDINSWEYYGISFSVGGEDTSPADIYFKDDGTKMFILGDTGNDVNEYALSTAWDVSSAGFTTNFSVAAQETSPAGLYFKPDGTRMYICGLTGVAPTGDRVYSYTLSTPWSLSSATYDSINFEITQDTAPQGVYLKNDDGTKMYVVGSTGDAIYEYSLGTAWDVSTAGLTTSILIGTGTTQNLPLTLTAPVGIDFNASGTKMYIIDNGRDIVSRFDLSTPWDINTAIFFDNVYIGFQELTSTGVFYQEDQSKAYIVGATGDRVYQYNTDVPSLELASSGISTRSSIILNNEARLNNRLYVTSDAHFSSPVTLKSTLQVDGSIVTSSNLTVSGGTITAGNVAASLLTGNTTTNISFATAQTTGTFTLGNTSGTGTITLGRATTSQQTDIQAGATASGNTKTINLGTGGLSGSTTRINIGPSAGDGVIFIGAGTSIGIGTTNPTAKLEPVDTAANPSVAPVVFIQRPNNVAPASIAPTNADLRIKSHSSNVKIYAEDHSANPLMILTGSGNLGIGTTNPSTRLEIVNTANDASLVEVTRFTASNSSGSTNFRVLSGHSNVDTSLRRVQLDAFRGDTNFAPITITQTNSNGTSERVRIDSSGNVGIGTTNPTQALHVQGNTLITGIATVSSSLIASSDVTFNTTASDVNLGTAQTTGRLILGGPSQTAQITLDQSSVTHTLGIATGASGVGTTKTINFGTGGLSGSNTQINIGPTAGDGVIFVGAGTSSVGIGTTRVDTLGHGGTNVVTQINNPATTLNSQSHIILTSAASTQVNSSVGTISWGLPTASATNKGIAYIAGLTGSGSTTGALSGKLVFATRNTTDSQFAERMVLNESGRVGIGSTLPTAALTIATVGSATTGASQIYLNGATSNRIDFNINGVAAPTLIGTSGTTRSAGTKIVLYPGSSASQVDYAFGIENNHIWQSIPVAVSGQGFKWYGGTTQLAILRGDGNLGIGTTNPNDLLHLSTSENAYIRAQRTASGSEGAVIIGASSLGNELYSRSTGNTAKDFRFVIGTAEALRINTSGFVGIGITNPGNNLQVAGSAAGIRLTDTTGAIGDLSSTGWLLYQRASNASISQSGFSILKDSGADVLTINSSGNLGIGITDPSTLLHLNSTDPTIRLKRSDAAANAYGEITSDTSGLIILKSDPGNAATNSGFSLTVDNIERVRVGSAGSVGIGITNATSRLYVLGDLASEYAATFFNDGNNANRFGIRIQCGVDTGSGTAIAINDGDGTNQGNVTFNAGTVTYGAFTANHDCVIPSYSQEIPYGSLMIVNKILYKKRIDGTEMERGIIYESGISTLPYVKNLLGAYSYQYDPDSPMQQAVDLPLHQVLVLGDGHIRCCNENGNIKIGDGITSSSMEGVGMRMNKIGMVIGIAQEDVDFTDTNEVKLVPVQYGLHQYIPDNISEYLETLINQ